MALIFYEGNFDSFLYIEVYSRTDLPLHIYPKKSHFLKSESFTFYRLYLQNNKDREV